MNDEPSFEADNSAKHWNEAWLDQLIDEALRLAEAKKETNIVLKK
jgi:hypothetical protein